MTPPRVHLVGRQNQGKTTLLVEMVGRLSADGVRVATAKHTGHDHPVDLPGKDSDRHRRAGGCPAAFITPGGLALFLPPASRPYEALAPMVQGCDLWLVEGDLEAEEVFKVEVFRAGQGHPAPLAAQRDDISLVVSDDEPEVRTPCCPRRDPELIARHMVQLAGPARGARCFILAGGQSRRFGSDKARTEVAGRSLLLRARDAAPLLAGVPQVVAACAGQYDDLGLATVGDLQPGQGPVGGLATALASLPAGAPWALLLPCDTVGLSRQWLQRLLDAPRAGRLAVAFRGGRWVPLPGLYHRDLLPLCHRLLAGRDAALWRVLEEAGAEALPLPDRWSELVQVNAQADLAPARRRAAR